MKENNRHKLIIDNYHLFLFKLKSQNYSVSRQGEQTTHRSNIHSRTRYFVTSESIIIITIVF
jgi:hypothetical protein